MTALDKNRIVAALVVARDHAAEGESLLESFTRIAITQVHADTRSPTRTADVLRINTMDIYRTLTELGMLSKVPQGPGRGRFSKPLAEAM